MAGSSGGRTAKDLVFMQLMVRLNFLQQVESVQHGSEVRPVVGQKGHFVSVLQVSH